MERNANKLNSVLRLLLQENGAPDEKFQIQTGKLMGPVLLLERTIDGTRKMPCHIPLFVGKIRTECTGLPGHLVQGEDSILGEHVLTGPRLFPSWHSART